MSLDNVTLRAATLDDLTGIAAIYNQLWCNTLRNRGDVEAADFCARFNIAMQLQRSPIALVAEAEGRIIAACCIGIFEDGKPRAYRPCARRARQGRLHQVLPDERLQLRLAVLRAPQHEAHPGGSQSRHRRRFYRLHVRRRHAGITR